VPDACARLASGQQGALDYLDAGIHNPGKILARERHGSPVY
jgi:hypothetical protein